MSHAFVTQMHVIMIVCPADFGFDVCAIAFGVGPVWLLCEVEPEGHPSSEVIGANSVALEVQGCSERFVAEKVLSFRKKNVKYAPILNKIRDIERKGRSNLRTIFNPCVITHNGELGTGMNDSIEVLAGFAKKRANDSESGTYRGELPAKATSIQRQHLRAAICCTLATGVGRILRTAGYPIGKKRHKQQGIHYDFADSPGPPAA